MINKIQCCGCRACEQICPRKCIRMITDKEGFIYPEIDKDKCIECGLCKKVCPIINNDEVKQKGDKKVYRLIAEDKELIEKSSSSGAFSLISKQIIENNINKKYKIFGSAFDKEFNVKHFGVNNIKEISKFRKSKYVQSDLQNCYSEAKKDLNDGKIVIFTGTPCQIAGLKNYLKEEEMKNLYTIDLICHGVPSPMIFRQYLKQLEKINKSRIKNFNFRERLQLFNITDSCGIKAELENNKVIKEYSFNNLYMLGFFKGLYYRPCCEFCPFANMDRVSDITIGDFWGINKKYKKLDPHKGISLCISNNEKGEKIIKDLSKKMQIIEEKMELAINNNNNLSEPSKFSRNRQKFFDELIKTENFEKSVKQFVKRKSKLRFFITSNIDDNMKNKIKNLIKNKGE